MNIFELHEKMTSHLFPPYSSTDERFLALALCGEVGELANMIKKRWRDGADLSEEIRDEIADIRVYLELLAKCFGIEGEKLDRQVYFKLQAVAKKHADRIGEAIMTSDEKEPRFAIQVDNDLWVRVEDEEKIGLVLPAKADTWPTREEAEKIRERCLEIWPQKIFYVRPHS